MTTAPALTADPDRPASIGWGRQVDVSTVPTRPGDDGGARQVAGYLAKYATKSTDASGALDHPIRDQEEIDALAVNAHLRRLVATAWQLGRQRHLAGVRLRAWAHTLGYRGHWATRSRRYSTTLKALREARQQWHQVDDDQLEDTDVVRVASWRFGGRGFRNAGDAWLAATGAKSQALVRRECLYSRLTTAA